VIYRKKRRRRRVKRQYPDLTVDVVEDSTAGGGGGLGWAGPLAAAAAAAAASQGLMSGGSLFSSSTTSTSTSSLLTGSALPGQLGGGILPLGNSFVVVQALALVPLGFLAVSAFPPYTKPRTFDAVTVIFRDEIHQIVSRFLERFLYMCPLLFSCVFQS
jgi:hypothetical protein